MRYVSLFSGIEAASAAWGRLGWVPVSFSEIDPFPSAVLSRRFPGVPNLGDITKIDWSKHGECVSADLVVGGSPCQSFSIAGTRTGLDGASGLMWEYVRAVRELRPRWVVWENVPGALSSSDGRDFGCLLEALDDLGYGLAWRVLDAQFFGVAQRRRRLFLVGSLGDQRASEVLFESESLRWDHPSSRAKRQALTGPAQGDAGGAGGGGGCLTPWDVQSRRIHDCDHAWPALYAGEGGGHGYVALTARMGTGGNQVPLIHEPDTYCLHNTGFGSDVDEDVSGTLLASDVNHPKAVAFLPNAGGRARSIALGEELSPTLKTDHNPAVACLPGPVSRTDTLFPGDGSVRRLTPTECERLQGFKDGWTDIPYRGAEHAPDSPRYKALGNSMAVPVMRWIGQRIQEAEGGACHGR